MIQTDPGARIDMPKAPPAPQAPQNRGIQLPGTGGNPMNRDGNKPQPPPIRCPGTNAPQQQM